MLLSVFMLGISGRLVMMQASAKAQHLVNNIAASYVVSDLLARAMKQSAWEKIGPASLLPHFLEMLHNAVQNFPDRNAIFEKTFALQGMQVSAVKITPFAPLRCLSL